MRSHVAIIAWLHIIVDGLVLLVGVGVMSLFGGLGALIAHAIGPNGGAEAAAGAALIGSVFLFFALIASLPGLIAGWGLLQGAEWARILMIVISIIDILHVPPVGVALGIYGLIVLFNPDVTAMFKQQRYTTQ